MTDQKTAEQYYGEGAEYAAPGTEYNAEWGEVRLGDNQHWEYIGELNLGKDVLIERIGIESRTREESESSLSANPSNEEFQNLIMNPEWLKHHFVGGYREFELGSCLTGGVGIGQFHLGTNPLENVYNYKVNGIRKNFVSVESLDKFITESSIFVNGGSELLNIGVAAGHIYYTGNPEIISAKHFNGKSYSWEISASGGYIDGGLQVAISEITNGGYLIFVGSMITTGISTPIVSGGMNHEQVTTVLNY